MAATLDGSPIFGIAVKIRHLPNPTAEQIDAFFGLSGQLALFGGGRGRMFAIEGVIEDVDLASVADDLANIMTYADGVARTLVDTLGRTWPNVIFEGQLVEGEPHPTDTGWMMPYRMTLRGLS